MNRHYPRGMNMTNEEKQQVHLVILQHEQGLSVTAHLTPAGHRRGAMEMMGSTIEELEKEIDGDKSGVKLLQRLKALVDSKSRTDNEVDKAVELYNDLYDQYTCGDEQHVLALQTCDLDESNPGHCKRCESELMADGHCPDETCPYSDHLQDETFTEE